MALSPRSVLIVLLAAAACRHPATVGAPEPQAAPVATAPAPAPGAVAAGSAAGAAVEDSAADLAAANADSAADQAALTALEDLEIKSLEKGTPNLGFLPAPNTPAVSGTEVASQASELFATPRGGAASAAAPTFDIDVESFATHDRVQAYVDFFLGPARDRFQIWLGRMVRYEGIVRSRFGSQGIPEDLVYLGLIESGFSNTAVSRAKAVGMWQFMAGTAKRYGLTVDQWVDERRDPFKATDAAARLLADLNGEFGSWYLAAAAYNGGAGRISRGLRRLPGAADSVSDGTFFRLSASRRYLKRETRDYVPKLIAAALIAKEPERYGFDSLPLLLPLAFDEAVVSEQTGLDVLARLADTTTSALLELNPQFFRGVTPPGRSVIVRVPRGAGAVVAQRWAELPAGERVTVIEHLVARGETISQIAKRYRVETAFILAANPGVKPRALRVGQRLAIPMSAGARAVAAAGRPRRAPPGDPAAAVSAVSRASTPEPRANATAAAAKARFHTVRAGESLWVIAQRYGVTVGELRRWNDLAPEDVLKPGQALIVRRPPAAAVGAAGPAN